MRVTVTSNTSRFPFCVRENFGCGRRRTYYRARGPWAARARTLGDEVVTQRPEVDEVRGLPVRRSVLHVRVPGERHIFLYVRARARIEARVGRSPMLQALLTSSVRFVRLAESIYGGSFGHLGPGSVPFEPSPASCRSKP